MAQDWNFTTVHQPGYNGRSIPYARGHVLGGSTSISEFSFNDKGSMFNVYRRLYGLYSWLEGWLWPLGTNCRRWRMVMGRSIPIHVKGPVHPSLYVTSPFPFLMDLLDGNTYSTPRPSKYIRRNWSQAPREFRYVMTVWKWNYLTIYIGPVNTSLPAHRVSTDSRVLKASKELSSQFPFNLDYNSGNTIGIGKSFPGIYLVG